MNPVFTGYPTSGPQATPEQYDLAKPVYFDADPMLVEGRQRRCPYITPYPPNFRRLEVREFPPKARTEVRSEDIDALVPGMIYIHFFFYATLAYHYAMFLPKGDFWTITMQSRYNAIFGVIRNGLCYKQILI